MREIKPDIVYVSNCGFGHVGPYERYKTWGPIVQAVSGLTFTSALPNQPPAGWGYSYMDHTGGYYMAMAILLALIHRKRTGEGQWVDLACTESALCLHGPALLDWTVNGRPTRQAVQPSSNRSQSPLMAPHGIYPCAGDDEWVAISVRDDDDWHQFRSLVADEAEWSSTPAYASVSGRARDQDTLDQQVASWTAPQQKAAVVAKLQSAGVPVAPVQKPQERVDQDPATEGFGLWPTVTHSQMGEVRVDGQPVHMSETDWQMERGAPCLSEHTEQVLTELLGMTGAEVAQLREEGVV